MDRDLTSLINLSVFYDNKCIVVAFWGFAFATSIYWGFDGIRELREEESEDAEEKCKKFFPILSRYTECIQANLSSICSIKSFAHFISDFFSSLIGWGALYLLLARQIAEKADNFDIFLGIIAVAGITGHGYRLPDWLSGKKE